MLILKNKNFSTLKLNATMSNLNVQKKISAEKQRRHQVYSALDYMISRITYFDFFSKDAFEVAANAKLYAQICQKENVTSEFILFSFFNEENDLTELLNEFKITKTRIGRYISKNTDLISQENSKMDLIFSKINSFFKPKSTLKVKNLSYSNDTNKLFEKAAENALTRFKTPVINSSILFITILENEDLLASKMVRHNIKKETDIYLLRYRILKTLHSHEHIVRETIKPHQHYFAYLLKTQLTDKQFSTLIQRESLSQSVSLFRDDLVSQVLKFDIFKMIEEEIMFSEKLLNSRNYTI